MVSSIAFLHMAASVIMVAIATAATMILVAHPTPTVALPITRKIYCRTAATTPSGTRRLPGAQQCGDAIRPARGTQPDLELTGTLYTVVVRLA